MCESQVKGCQLLDCVVVKAQNIVWGNNIVWGTNIVWGNRFIGAMSDDGDNIVWVRSLSGYRLGVVLPKGYAFTSSNIAAQMSTTADGRVRLAFASPSGQANNLTIHARKTAVAFQPSPFTDVVTGAIAEITGRKPVLSTSGGTSDARFIKDYCPVVEFGLVGQTMHAVDERVPVTDLEKLTAVYRDRKSTR